MRILRWILVLPVALLGFLLVVVGGITATVLFSEPGVVPATPDSILSYGTAMLLNAMGGLVMVWGAMKTAPAEKRVVGEYILIGVLIYYVYTYFFTSVNLGIHTILQDLAVFVGAWYGYSRIAGTWNIRGLE